MEIFEQCAGCKKKFSKNDKVCSGCEADLVAQRRKDFIRSELWILSWNAAVQRAKVYSKLPKKYDQEATSCRQRFRKELIEYAESNLIPQYRKALKVCEEQHLGNIVSLADEGTKLGDKFSKELGRKFLRNGKWRIGVAQKMLNLYLKYLWCNGDIESPPHCPVDSLIIAECTPSKNVKVPKSKLKRWTNIAKIKEYEDSVALIKEQVRGRDFSISEWELMNFDRRLASSD